VSLHAQPDTLRDQIYLQGAGPRAVSVEAFAAALGYSDAHASTRLAQYARDGLLTRHQQTVPAEVSGTGRRLLYRAAVQGATPCTDFSDGSATTWQQPWPTETEARYLQALRTLNAALESLSEQGAPAGSAETAGNSATGLSLRQVAWQICEDLGALDTDLGRLSVMLSVGLTAPETPAHRLALTLARFSERHRQDEPRLSVAALYAAGVALA